MSGGLDILAVEPFYGGQRKWVLDVITRLSRHRWRTMTLPARRIQRRVATSAVWFAEQYHRHPITRVDALFVTDALNLSEFIRLVPPMTRIPSLLYFQDNELAAPTDDDLTGTTANLASAMAAGRFYFNSVFHKQMFMARLDVLARTQPDLAGNTPSAELLARADVLPPPLDMEILNTSTTIPPTTTPQTYPRATRRMRRRILVDTHSADMDLLNGALELVARAGQIFEIACYGPTAGLPEEFLVKRIPETDFVQLAEGLREAGLYVSTHRASLCDLTPLLALVAGAGVIVPAEGSFRDAFPEPLHAWNLYQPTAPKLRDRIVDHLTLAAPADLSSLTEAALAPHEAKRAVRAIDDALEELAAGE